MATLSAKITVTTATTRVQGTDLGFGSFLIHPDPANTGYIYVGGSDVAAANGCKLAVGDSVIYTGHLSDVWFDASANAQVATVLKIEGMNAL